jgi:hypothetical protein
MGADQKEYHAHFDCFSGAAGDMLLASCLDASGDPDGLRDHVTKCLARGMPELADEFQIVTEKVWRGEMGSIAGRHVTVVSKYKHTPAPVPRRTNDKRGDQSHNHNHGHDHHHEHHRELHHNHEHEHEHHHTHEDQNENENEHHHEHQHEHQQSHQHHSSAAETNQEEPELANTANNGEHSPDPESHSRGHNHSHGHSHSHVHRHHTHSASSSHSNGPLRNLTEIRKLLEDSDETYIAPWVRSTAIAAFTELAHAEAQTHGAESIDAVHFHEVGAVDSIVDTVGTLVALHHLGCTTSFSCSRIPIGEGSVWSDHGILPVPAPAALRLLVGLPTCPGPRGVVTGELVTPTGAALLRTLCLVGNGEGPPPPEPTGRPPCFTIRKIGIGAGTKDFVKHPNILRLLIGDDVVTR